MQHMVKKIAQVSTFFMMIYVFRYDNYIYDYVNLTQS